MHIPMLLGLEVAYCIARYSNSGKPLIWLPLYIHIVIVVIIISSPPLHL